MAMRAVRGPERLILRRCEIRATRFDLLVCRLRGAKSRCLRTPRAARLTAATDAMHSMTKPRDVSKLSPEQTSMLANVAQYPTRVIEKPRMSALNCHGLMRERQQA
jgi:hypothetical protein